MAVTVKQEVAALYSAIFNRAPDQAGLEFWVNAIEGGDSLVKAAEGFTQHPVFAETYAGLTNIQFVQQLYVNVLGSAGDAKGIQFWTDKLASGVSQGQVVAEFVQGSLAIDLDALLASGELSQADYDAAVVRQDSITNKATVGVYFAETFGAASNLDAATDTTTVEGLAADPAYLASQAAIANVNASAASVTAAQGRIDVAVGTADPVGSLVGQNSELTAALAALSEANGDVADFADEVEAFQAANELTENGSIATLISEAQGQLDVAAGGSNVSLNVAKGALVDLNEELTQARAALAVQQAKVNAVTDLNKALSAEQLVEEATKVSNDAAAAAAVADAAADAASSAISDGAEYTYAAAPTSAGASVGLVSSTTAVDGSTVAAFDLISINASGALVVADAFKNVVGINKLLEVVKAAQVAGAEASAAQSDLTAATTAYTAELQKIVSDNSKLVSDYESAQDAVSNPTAGTGLVEQIADLEEAISLFEGAASLRTQYAELTGAVDDAEAVVEALVDTYSYLGATGAATANDDLFIFNGVGSTVSGFGQNGTDLLFVGTNYAAGTGDYAKSEGNANVLEVFITQGASGAEVHIETETFGSNAAGQGDVATIVLTGVAATDVVFENGFVSFA